VAAVVFMIAAVAEVNRTPFDLPEGESEIVGYHVEYSSLKFALFFMAEYVNVVVASGVLTTLFFGGWQIPWLPTPALEEHARSVLLVTCGSVAVLTTALALVSLRWSKSLKRLYTDLRRREGDFWAAVLFVIAVLALAVGAVAIVVPMGPTAAAIFARIAQLGIFLGKVVFFSFCFIWVRWTLPRFRYDQLMSLGWKSLLPLALANIAATAIALRWLGR
jgi:NADH-quinone oxidoreductase subunit H